MGGHVMPCVPVSLPRCRLWMWSISFVFVWLGYRREQLMEEVLRKMHVRVFAIVLGFHWLGRRVQGGEGALTSGNSPAIEIEMNNGHVPHRINRFERVSARRTSHHSPSQRRCTDGKRFVFLFLRDSRSSLQ